MAIRGPLAPATFGDNLFTASIIALDAKTGQYVWHYQETPSENFDFDSTAQLTTADLLINGQKKHVVMHAPKNGVFYVLDAKTGKVQSADLFIPTANWLKAALTRTSGRSPTPKANYGKTGRRLLPGGFPVARLVPDVLQSRHGAWSTCQPTTAALAMWPRPARRWAINCSPSTSPSVPRARPPKVEGAGNYLVAWDPVKKTGCLDTA